MSETSQTQLVYSTPFAYCPVICFIFPTYEVDISNEHFTGALNDTCIYIYRLRKN